jgi:uncharacterized protein (DUF2235 family)
MSMPKNIVVCCDGTGNEISANLSNVLKLYRIVLKNDRQAVFYDPGIGTLSSSDAWSRFRSNAKQIFWLMTGYGLDQNILDAYSFLIDTYEDGDQVYLFGFSRGAYTIRAVAGFMYLIGLLDRNQKHLCGYALTAYKRAAEEGQFDIGWRFERIMSTGRVPIRFMGVWDTVSSIIVPRPDRLYIPSRQRLPYTATNPLVQVFRHAIAIDERRRMFRINRWTEPQEYNPNPFGNAERQDVKQAWFVGVHSDVGGGYSEEESGLAKLPLKWMIDEAKEHGLLINTAMFNHLVLGHERKGGSRNYVKPDAGAASHDSMSWGWQILEWLPKSLRRREWPTRRSLSGVAYLPRSEPRLINSGALIHSSVIERMEIIPHYRPINLPPEHVVEGQAGSPPAAPPRGEH